MQRTAPNDAAFIFQNDEISYVLANLRQRAGSKVPSPE
jgi:hypothetical protein